MVALLILLLISYAGKVAELLNNGIGHHPGHFPSYDETLAALDHIQTVNPLFVTRLPAGISYQCRTMWSYLVSMAPLENPQTFANLTKSINDEESEAISRCSKAQLDRRTQKDFTWLMTSSKAASKHFSESEGDSPEIVNLMADQQFRLTNNLWHMWSAKRLLGSYDAPSVVKFKGFDQQKSMRGFRLPERVQAAPQLAEFRSVQSRGSEPKRPQDLSLWLNELNLFRNDLRGRVLLTSLHHAREPASLTVGMTVFSSIVDSLNALVNELNEKTDSKTRKATSKRGIPSLMAHRHLLYLPFVNPDGYVAIETTGNTLIRKNQRPTCTNKPTNATILLNGVDLNRNYDSHFVQEHTQCHPEEYEGTGPFSEPETRAVRRLVRLFQPHVALNYHAYGDLWTRPWNCCPDRKHDPRTLSIFNEIHETLNITQFGSAPELPQLNYTATGEADDWIMGQYGTLSMSPEVGPESEQFYPSQGEVIQQINSDNLKRTLHVMSKAGIELNVNLAYLACGDQQSNSPVLSLFNSGLGQSGDMIMFLGKMDDPVKGVTAIRDRFSPFAWKTDLGSIESFAVPNLGSRSHSEPFNSIQLNSTYSYQVCVRPKMQPELSTNKAELASHLLSGCLCSDLLTSSTCVPGAVATIPLHLDNKLPRAHPCYHIQKLDKPESMDTPTLAS